MVLVLALAATGFVAAGDLEKGEKETSFRFSFSDTDLGSSGGFDLGSVETIETAITYGWMVTDQHELGILASYFNEDVDGGGVGPDTEVDGTGVGGFYNLNFNTQGNAIPYFGVAVVKLGGDLGDFYDLRYGAEVGVKVYPFKHAGFSFGVSYTKQTADASGIDDATTVSAGAGLLLKY